MRATVSVPSHGRGVSPGRRRLEPEVARIRSEPGGADELGVELAERHRPGRV